MKGTRGFFKPGEVGKFSQSLSVIRQPACGACGLYKGCLSPKMPRYGEGRRKILILGEAPGEKEDEQGRPFVGKSGQHLQACLRKSGVNLFQDCWVMNSLSCRPKANKLPKDPGKLISHCRPLVLKAVKELNPEVIILLGAVPVQSLIGWLWKEDVGGIVKWAGHKIPSVRLNAWVCPTLHPSFVLREAERRGGEVAGALFQEHLDAATALEGRPYPHQPPDYERLIRRCVDPEEAAVYLHRFIDAKRPVAFDYETDRLKPDHPQARVVSCAVSDGVVSVAFPWHGEAVEAFKELVTSPIPKIGHNVKFEQRWTRKALGVGVNNWAIDGMLAAHTLDSRKGTKSLKFRAFVHLGCDSYNDAVEAYLKADGGNARNRITELSLDKLLTYCGMDALLEFKLGTMLAKQVGVEL